MKKFLLTLTAVIMAVAMCFGIAACKDDKPSSEGGLIEDDGDDKKGDEGEKEVTAESITLSVETVTLDIDGTQALTYTVVPAAAKVKVEISDTTVVKYENDTLTAITAGTATVKVVAVSDASVSAQCAVTVNVPEGYALHKANNYKFIYPENWTKFSSYGAEVAYRESYSGPNMNLISSSKNDPSWTISESSLRSQMKSVYEQLGYTVNSLTVNITDDTHMGGKRRFVAYDLDISVNGVRTQMHQEQVLLQNSSKSYVLTIAYTGSYNADDISLMLSQFAVYN